MNKAMMMETQDIGSMYIYEFIEEPDKEGDGIEWYTVVRKWTFQYKPSNISFRAQFLPTGRDQE